MFNIILYKRSRRRVGTLKNRKSIVIELVFKNCYFDCTHTHIMRVPVCTNKDTIRYTWCINSIYNSFVRKTDGKYIMHTTCLHIIHSTYYSNDLLRATPAGSTRCGWLRVLWKSERVCCNPRVLKHQTISLYDSISGVEGRSGEFFMVVVVGGGYSKITFNGKPVQGFVPSTPPF